MLCISLNVFEDIFNLKNHFFNSKIFSITRCYWHIFNKCKILFVICLYFWCFWTVVLEKTLKSPLDCKEIKSVNHKGYQSWIFIGSTDAEIKSPNTLATWWEELTHWKSESVSWCWERLKAGGEGDNRWWDDWMASLTWWTWVWANLGSWWWTGKPGVLQSMGSQRVRHDWANELKWTCLHTNLNLGGVRFLE